MLLLTLLGGWEGLQKLAIPVWTRPTGSLGGSFPLMTRQKLKSNYSNSIRTNPYPLNYLYISGGVSSPHPPKTIFLRRDILFVPYAKNLVAPAVLFNSTTQLIQLAIKQEWLI
jgi:hypothetical protein